MHTETRLADGWQLEGNSAEAYERYLAMAFSPWARQLTELAGIRQRERVLDVACGTGIVARHAAERAGDQGTVVGLDLNPAMLEVARSVTAGLSPSLEWRLGSAAELPFASAAFDAVLCEQGMQFFPDPVRALGEMHRVLTPSGRAAVSVCRPLRYCPTYVALAGALDRHVGADAGAMMRSPFSPWSVDELRSLFSAAGFPTIQVRIEVASIRYPSVEEFVRREAASSPLAGPIGGAGVEARQALIRDVEDAVADHSDDLGVVCPIESYVVLASR